MKTEMFTVNKKKLVSCNIMTAHAGSNCPQGGDSGHGGRTIIGLIDDGGTTWNIAIEREDGEIIKIGNPKRLSLGFYGDSEHGVLIKALEFFLKKLKKR